jgi:hypothetical protein
MRRHSSNSSSEIIRAENRLFRTRIHAKYQERKPFFAVAEAERRGVEGPKGWMVGNSKIVVDSRIVEASKLKMVQPRRN